MNIVIRTKVENQLKAILRYNLEIESRERANKIVDSLFQAFYKIAANPLPYAKHRHYGHLKADTRKMVVHSTYIVTFRIFKTHIAILDVYHGKRKPI